MKRPQTEQDARDIAIIKTVGILIGVLFFSWAYARLLLFPILAFSGITYSIQDEASAVVIIMGIQFLFTLIALAVWRLFLRPAKHVRDNKRNPI